MEYVTFTKLHCLATKYYIRKESNYSINKINVKTTSKLIEFIENIF